ncbi:hypothetical protein SUGI_0859550 [Cryptomeria japonica]|nr:hypothetical protein SUGI_0859550 [Cryptomeria japonica]
MIENNLFEEVVDPKLKQDGLDNFALEEALAVANIALKCAHPDKAGRPDMNLVVTKLTSLMSRGCNNIARQHREEEIVPLETVTD